MPLISRLILLTCICIGVACLLGNHQGKQAFLTAMWEVGHDQCVFQRELFKTTPSPNWAMARALANLTEGKQSGIAG